MAFEPIRRSDREPERCIHVSDRESDIYELFCLASTFGTSFRVRVQTDRLACAGGDKVAAEMADEPPCAAHVIEIRTGKGDAVAVTLDVKVRPFHVLPPIGKQKHYPPLTLSDIHARQSDQPTDRDRVDWRPVTILPVRSAEQAIEKLSWYVLRWKIEVFHKILKSGCRAE